MAGIELERMHDHVSQVRENPGVPYDVGKNLGLEDLRASMTTARAALIEAIEAASDSSFREQPDNESGEEVWSVGEIVGHCNGALVGIGSSALALIGEQGNSALERLGGLSEPVVMSRDEALAAARFRCARLLSVISDDEKLDTTETHDFFGPVSARSWLYFMAIHESEHVFQIRSLD